MTLLIPMVVAVLLGACNDVVSGTDAEPPAATDDAGSSDAGNVPVHADVDCQDYTQTIVFSTGARSVTVTRAALIDGIGPEDEFLTQHCGQHTIPAASGCPVGATCTGSSGPPGEGCYVTRGTGYFVGGKLLVSCGYKATTYNADGSVAYANENAYDSITVTKL
jgi:hypothetical protein